jgi:hypothetical protein
MLTSARYCAHHSGNNRSADDSFRRSCSEITSSIVETISEYFKQYRFDEMCKHSPNGVLNDFYHFYGLLDEAMSILQEPKTVSFKDRPLDAPLTCLGKPPLSLHSLLFVHG